MNISVVIPAYNESKRISKSLLELEDYLKIIKCNYEIIVVNDGSKDNTSETVKALNIDKLKLIDYKPNKGKGYAVRKGMLEAEGDYILFMDADMATPIDQLPLFVEALDKGAQFAYGIRTYQKYDNKKRFILGIGFVLLAHLLVLQSPVLDTQCGFKIFKKDAAKFIFNKMRINGGTFDIEMFYIAQKNNISGSFIPVRWIDVQGSTINILKCILFDPFDLIRIRLNGIFNLYKQK